MSLLGGAAVAWPLVARAQQRDRLRRVVVVMQYLETDSQGQLRAAAFREGLEKAGWVSGRNISVDYLWGVMDSEWTRGITEHLRQRVPDVIAINSSIGLRAIESAAPGVPIVFIAVSEPVAQGFVASLAYPGGNIRVSPIWNRRLERNGSICSSGSHHKRLVLRLSTIAVIPVPK